MVDAFHPILADGSRDLDGHEQAGGQGKVNRRAAQLFPNLAERPVARIESNRADDEKLRELRHVGRFRCSR
jgi:hypothetical protein